MANNDNYISGYLKGILSEPVSLTGYLNNVALRGIPVELRINEEDVLQWHYVGDDDWIDLIKLNDRDYEMLRNLPTLNGIELTGELKELFMLPSDEISTEELNNLLNDE